MNAVNLSFDPNEKQRENSLATKRMGAVESDTLKSARKAKGKLHKACERSSEARERTLHGQDQNNTHGKPERVTRQCSVSNQHTSTITCTAAPRVWHFSAFHVAKVRVYILFVYIVLL